MERSETCPVCGRVKSLTTLSYFFQVILSHSIIKILLCCQLSLPKIWICVDLRTLTLFISINPLYGRPKIINFRWSKNWPAFHHSFSAPRFNNMHINFGESWLIILHIHWYFGFPLLFYSTYLLVHVK